VARFASIKQLKSRCIGCNNSSYLLSESAAISECAFFCVWFFLKCETEFYKTDFAQRMYPNDQRRKEGGWRGRPVLTMFSLSDLLLRLWNRLYPPQLVWGKSDS
jgi:hypothetical protein